MFYCDTCKRAVKDMDVYDHQHKGEEMTVSEERAQTAIAKVAQRKKDVRRAKSLKVQAYSNKEIARVMGKSESTVRALLEDRTVGIKMLKSTTGKTHTIQRDTMNKYEIVADLLESELKKHSLLNVGPAILPVLGVSVSTFIRAIELLTKRGYKRFYVKVGSNTVRVLATSEWTFPQVFENRDKIYVLGSTERVILDEFRNNPIVAVTKGRPSRRTITTVQTNTLPEPVVVTSSVSSLVLRMRQLKRKGESNVSIGKTLGVSESTVRRHLKKALNDRELLVEYMLEELEDAREHLLRSVVDSAVFEDVFGEGYGDDWLWRVHTSQRNATVTKDRVTFNLQFEAHRRNTHKED
jgi:DNA-binding CsgD family transcriptional regulator